QVFWFPGIAIDVENENATGIKASQPDLVSIIGKPGMVRFVATFNRRSADDFTVGRRPWFYIDGDQFIHPVTETFDAERPDINEFLLTVDAGKVRRRTGFIGADKTVIENKRQRSRKKQSYFRCIHLERV